MPSTHPSSLCSDLPQKICLSSPAWSSNSSSFAFRALQDTAPFLPILPLPSFHTSGKCPLWAQSCWQHLFWGKEASSLGNNHQPLQAPHVQFGQWCWLELERRKKKKPKIKIYLSHCSQELLNTQSMEQSESLGKCSHWQVLHAIVTRAGTNLCQVCNVKYREGDELFVFSSVGVSWSQQSGCLARQSNYRK